MTLANALSTARWNQAPGLPAWLRGSRLDIYSSVGLGDPPAAEQLKVLGELGTYTPAAIANLPRLIEQIEN